MSIEIPPPGGDNRRQQRLAARPSTHGFCHPSASPSGANLCVRLKDLSQIGACLVMRERLPAGAAVELVLISPSMFCREQLVAEVIWQADDEEEGGFLTGLHFRSPLTRFALLDFAVQHQEGELDLVART
jgi:hypothetical protein